MQFSIILKYLLTLLVVVLEYCLNNYPPHNYLFNNIKLIVINNPIYLQYHIKLAMRIKVYSWQQKNSARSRWDPVI